MDDDLRLKLKDLSASMQSRASELALPGGEHGYFRADVWNRSHIGGACGDRRRNAGSPFWAEFRARRGWQGD